MGAWIAVGKKVFMSLLVHAYKWSVTPPIRHQFKQLMSMLWTLLVYFSSAEIMGISNDFQGRKDAAIYLFAINGFCLHLSPQKAYRHTAPHRTLSTAERSKAAFQSLCFSRVFIGSADAAGPFWKQLLCWQTRRRYQMWTPRNLKLWNLSTFHSVPVDE